MGAMTALARVPGQLPAFPGAITHAGVIYTSGCVDPDALRGESRDAEQQAMCALQVLLTTIQQAGGDADTVLRVQAFLSSSVGLAAWAQAFEACWPGAAPTRTTLITNLALPSLTIEVQAIAAIREPSDGSERLTD